VVLALNVVEPWARDREDRYAPPVRAAHLDRLELAATHEPEGSEEEVVRLKHWALPVDCGRRGGVASDTDRGGPVSPLISGRRRGHPPRSTRRRSASRKPPFPRKLSSGFAALQFYGFLPYEFKTYS